MKIVFICIIVFFFLLIELIYFYKGIILEDWCKWEGVYFVEEWMFKFIEWKFNIEKVGFIGV